VPGVCGPQPGALGAAPTRCASQPALGRPGPHAPAVAARAWGLAADHRAGARTRAARLPIPLPMAAGGGSRNGAAAPAPPAGLAIGDPAPALALPDLSDQTVDLADFRGRPTLVLFWGPRCGFCNQMLDDLKA